MSVSLIVVGKPDNKRVQVDERTTLPNRTHHNWKVRHFNVPQDNADKFVETANKTHNLYSKISRTTLTLGVFTFAVAAFASLINGLALLCGAKFPKKVFFQTLALSIAGLVGGTGLTLGATKLSDYKYNNLKEQFDVKEITL